MCSWLIVEEVSTAGCHAAAGHAQMYTMGTVLRHGSAQQKQKYLPEIAAGRLRLQAFAVIEPTTGSDTTQLKTRAERTATGYRLNGQKVWTSRALHSDLMLVLARTTPATEVRNKVDGISTFLIDIRESLDKGLTIRPIKAMINHHTTEVFFDNLDIPADSVIGEEGKGFRLWRAISPPRPRGTPPRRACKPTAASASPANTTSSAGGAKPRLGRIAPVSTNLILAHVAQHVLGMPRSY